MECVICYETIDREYIDCYNCHSRCHPECWEEVSDKSRCPYCRCDVHKHAVEINDEEVTGLTFKEPPIINVQRIHFIDCIFETGKEMFKNANVESIVFTNCSVRGSCHNMFLNCESHKIDLRELNMAAVTDASHMFDGCVNLAVLNFI